MVRGDMMTAGERHRLAMRVARAARLAGGPIGYYHAYADIRDCEAHGVLDVEAYYADHFGDEVWARSAPDISAAVVEVRAC